MEEKAAQPSVYDADDQWILDHLQELIDKYAGKHVSVLDERILLVSDDPVEIDRLAAEKYPGRLPSVDPVPFEEDFDCLLLLGRRDVFDEFRITFDERERLGSGLSATTETIAGSLRQAFSTRLGGHPPSRD